MGAPIVPQSQSKTFTVDARTVLQLGRQSIKDHTTAVVELVKNCYDADATRVEVEICQNVDVPYIRIADNGTGMSEEAIDRRWLRIGYSEKLAQPLSTRKRRKTGEKGVGRISADRLGATLRLRSKEAKEGPVELLVNWDSFDVSGQDLASVPLFFQRGVPPRLPKSRRVGANTGTELWITSLRQHWSLNDIRALYEELSYLTPPFIKVIDFSIGFRTDIAPEYNGDVSSPFHDVAEIDLAATVSSGVVTFEISDRIGKKTLTVVDTGVVPLVQLVQRTDKKPTEEPRLSSVGTVSVRLMVYPRRAETVAGTDLHLKDLRDFLDRNAGVKIYRDDIRVRPYGDPESAEGDWLSLADRKSRDPAGVGRASYRISANQLVGGVFVSRDGNPSLLDSAGREGLIHNEAFTDLKRFVLGCLTLVESHRHQAYQREAKSVRVADPMTRVTETKDALATLRADITAARRSVPEAHSRSIDRVLDSVQVLNSRLRATEEAVRDALSEAGVLRGLASVGIAASVFGHETQSSLSSLRASTTLLQAVLGRAVIDTEKARREGEKIARYVRQVSAWGAFALARVSKDKRQRRKVPINRTIATLAKDLEQVFESAGIQLTTHSDALFLRTFEMDVEAILLNLLTNAYAACLQVSSSRAVHIEAASAERDGKDGIILTVGDSGPGVDEQLYEKVWHPLFTTRTDQNGRQVGTGLGLSIVRSITKDLGGVANVGKDVALGGASFQIWLPKG